MGAAMVVTECLRGNPVLRHAEVRASESEETGTLLGIRAAVEATAANQMGVLMALNAADEQWCYALAQADCVPCTARSQLRVQGGG